MQLRNTLIFIPAGETEVVKVEVYTVDDLSGTGYWNIDNNKVLLPAQLYSEFKSCKTQLEQKKFFSTLRRISNQQI